MDARAGMSDAGADEELSEGLHDQLTELHARPPLAQGVTTRQNTELGPLFL